MKTSLKLFKSQKIVRDGNIPSPCCLRDLKINDVELKLQVWTEGYKNYEL